MVSKFFCFHPDPWGNDPISHIFNWVETTNYKSLQYFTCSLNWAGKDWYIYIFIKIPGTCLSLFWGWYPRKEGPNSIQNNDHLGSRYVYIYIYSPTKNTSTHHGLPFAPNAVRSKFKLLGLEMGSRLWVHAASPFDLFSPRYMIKLEQVYPPEVWHSLWKDGGWKLEDNPYFPIGFR